MTDRQLPKLLGPLLHRGPGQVQVGVDPARAVVLDGLLEDEVGALQALDGTHPVPGPLATPDGARVLALLADCGLLVDASGPRSLPPAERALLDDDVQALLRLTTPSQDGYAVAGARRASCVLVAGRGSVPDAVSGTLRRAGVGTVHTGRVAADAWEQDDLDRAREPGRPASGPPASGPPASGPPASGRAAPGAGLPAPGLVVLTASHALDPRAAQPWLRRDVPVLPVVVGATEAVVGPVVDPRVPDGPCLACLDLSRTDLDPAWPRLLEQLTRPTVGADPEIGGEASLVAMAAAMTAMVGLGVLDGRTLPTGRSLEVGLPWPGVRQRYWSAHPRCTGAHGPAVSRQAADDTVASPADGQDAPQVRMAG
ncbi:ThiF family adenylyltransferase [Phycicoccus ginsengisoli]